MKIGNRLSVLVRMINNNYEHIWDCCCDHGLLGMKVLEEHKESNVHFVDIVEPIIDQLESKLDQYFSSSNNRLRWRTYCQNISNIKVERSDSQLIIIAGVGGDKTIEFVESILNNNKSNHLEFLLCPVHHNYKVRKGLKELGFGLIDEVLIKENDRFYEAMHVSMRSSTVLSIVGSKMWDLSRVNDLEYLNRTIQYYQAKSKNKENDLTSILAEYMTLKSRY